MEKTFDMGRATATPMVSIGRPKTKAMASRNGTANRFTSTRPSNQTNMTSWIQPPGTADGLVKKREGAINDCFKTSPLSKHQGILNIR